jgi:hypothetical protein
MSSSKADLQTFQRLSIEKEKKKEGKRQKEEEQDDIGTE